MPCDRVLHDVCFVDSARFVVVKGRSERPLTRIRELDGGGVVSLTKIYLHSDLRSAFVAHMHEQVRQQR